MNKDTLLTQFLSRAETFFERVEQYLKGQSISSGPDWSAQAFRWCSTKAGGALHAIHSTGHSQLDDLLGIDVQKQTLERNTRQFVQGLPCNHALLWGARGTGKSSLVKALLTAYAADGLRLLEVNTDDLFDLPEIMAALTSRPERFVLFVDDLAFEVDDPRYRALKALLDGSVSGIAENILIYATSNRRHLMPEFMRENIESQRYGGEIHPGESVEEKVSLSERFGLWLSFQPFNQEAYLRIVAHWLQRMAPDLHLDDESRGAALRWALQRGSRSGRIAKQFVADWVGARKLL